VKWTPGDRHLLALGQRLRHLSLRRVGKDERAGANSMNQFGPEFRKIDFLRRAQLRVVLANFSKTSQCYQLVNFMLTIYGNFCPFSEK
jgi:hypothetical protein